LDSEIVLFVTGFYSPSRSHAGGNHFRARTLYQNEPVKGRRSRVK
jgi:hypothetical protein